MIYISIPKGMSFKQLIENQTKVDYFVSEDGKKIELQSLVKNFLRSNSARNKSIQINEIEIHLRTPPNSNDDYLAYSPNCNGKYPTQIEPKVVKGSEAQKYNPNSVSKYGSFWYQNAPISSEKVNHLKENQIAQKENRRHYGDSPSST